MLIKYKNNNSIVIYLKKAFQISYSENFYLALTLLAIY